MKTKIKIFLAVMLLSAIAYTAYLGVKAIAMPLKVNAAAATFDHTGCQYPDRTTNPVDSCDNSDPCDPAQVKGGSGDCVEPSESEKGSAPYSDPNRDYYDQYGNRYDYQGTLKQAAPAEVVKTSTCSDNK